MNETTFDLPAILEEHAKWLRDDGLSRADLSYANLSYANLIDANLRGANLRGANLSGANLTDFSNCPDAGEFTGWKQLQYGRIARLLIPEDARRVSPAVGRKCRAEFVRVVSIVDANGQQVTTGNSTYDGTLYTVGEIIKPDRFDDDIRVECTHGIHFFITKKEAEQH